MSRGRVYAVGIGPGAKDLLTPRAKEVIESVDVIVGYHKYVDTIKNLIPNSKEVITSGMKGEVERCDAAIEKAKEGLQVAVVSSGDPGIYGMAGLILEMLEDNSESQIEFESVPGVTAASAAASVLGAPLMNDFVVVSLSDLLTPIEDIKKRIDAAIAGDFVCVLYNPRSKKRVELFSKVVDRFIEMRGETTKFGVVKYASSSEKQEVYTGELTDLPIEKVDMSTVVLIGNSKTVLRDGKLYTLRGYSEKYDF
jgi:precorrin-3B C17-methyltransferase